MPFAGAVQRAVAHGFHKAHSSRLRQFLPACLMPFAAITRFQMLILPLRYAAPAFAVA